MVDYDIGYLAAAIDYEGAIGISKQIRKSGGIYYNAYMAVVNTEIELLEPLAYAFGGNITFSRVQLGNRSDIWRWTAYGYRVLDILNAIKCKVKSIRKLKLIDVVERWANADQMHLREERYKLYLEAKELNMRGNRNHDVVRHWKPDARGNCSPVPFSKRKNKVKDNIFLGIPMDEIQYE